MCLKNYPQILAMASQPRSIFVQLLVYMSSISFKSLAIGDGVSNKWDNATPRLYRYAQKHIKMSKPTAQH